MMKNIFNITHNIFNNYSFVLSKITKCFEDEE